MHITIHICVKLQIQNLPKADIVFLRALAREKNLPNNTFCLTLCDSNKQMRRSLLPTSVGGTATFKEELVSEALINARWCNISLLGNVGRGYHYQYHSRDGDKCGEGVQGKKVLSNQYHSRHGNKCGEGVQGKNVLSNQCDSRYGNKCRDGV